MTPSRGTITYEDPDSGERFTVPVTGGRCKLQWKPDWAMRWPALGVDYEMAGKDLIDSVKLSGEICKAIGGAPPEASTTSCSSTRRARRSRSRRATASPSRNGCATPSPESLSLFMYREPKAAKRLYFDVIPRNVDDYQQFLDGYRRQDAKQRLSNPVWHIHAGEPPQADMPVSFSMLLTLVSSSNAENAETLWGFIGRYRPGVTPQTHPQARRAWSATRSTISAISCCRPRRSATRTKPSARRSRTCATRSTTCRRTRRRSRSRTWSTRSAAAPPFLDEGKKAKDGRPGVSLDWFNMLYQVLLGQEKGPRFGSFVAVYGLRNTVEMIDGALARSSA